MPAQAVFGSLASSRRSRSARAANPSAPRSARAPPRTRITVRRSRIGKSEASKRSLLAACRLVPAHAMLSFRPIPMIGNPAGISPAACSPGERNEAAIHTFGSATERCGSAASNPAPLRLRPPATTAALLPWRANALIAAAACSSASAGSALARGAAKAHAIRSPRAKRASPATAPRSSSSRPPPRPLLR